MPCWSSLASSVGSSEKTKLPRCGSTISRPSISRRLIASRTGVRLTCISEAIRASESWLPSSRSPEMIQSRRVSETSSVNDLGRSKFFIAASFARP